MIELKCKELSKRVLNEIKEKTLLFVNEGNRAPSLAVVLVGNNPSSLSYVKSKSKRCEELGFVHFQYSLSEDSLESEVIGLIERLNADDNVDGILVQLPLPSHISSERVINSISPEKDVDGFSVSSMGNLVLGRPTFVPCTPLGILRILKNWNIETKGRRICVIGRSNIVGRPLSVLLSSRGWDGTVTLCNSFTENLRDITLSSDIIITAVGKSEFFDSSYFRDGSVVIDVGINRVEDSTREKGYRLTGDCLYSSFSDRDISITPVPGGVGLMTVTGLMMNTLQAAEWRRKR